MSTDREQREGPGIRRTSEDLQEGDVVHVDDAVAEYGVVTRVDPVWIHYVRSGLEARARAVPAYQVIDVDEILGADWYDQYFQSTPHEYSSITAYERYLRLQREQGHKVIRSDGVLRKILELLGDQEGMKMVYSLDNTEIVGYNHQLRLDADAVSQLFDGQRYGKQFKHYHPEHVRSSDDDDDPLYHPKFGALFKKNLNDGAVPWHQHRELTQELEEEIVNILAWSDVSTKPGPQFVADDHFDVQESGRKISIQNDPAPEIEAEQESVLIRTMRQLQDSDRDVLVVVDVG